jgi:hypothetical protein
LTKDEVVIANGVVSIVIDALSGLDPPPFLICTLPVLAFEGIAILMLVSSMTV